MPTTAMVIILEVVVNFSDKILPINPTVARYLATSINMRSNSLLRSSCFIN